MNLVQLFWFCSFVVLVFGWKNENQNSKGLKKSSSNTRRGVYNGLDNPNIRILGSLLSAKRSYVTPFTQGVHAAVGRLRNHIPTFRKKTKARFLNKGEVASGSSSGDLHHGTVGNGFPSTLALLKKIPLSLIQFLTKLKKKAFSTFSNKVTTNDGTLAFNNNINKGLSKSNGKLMSSFSNNHSQNLKSFQSKITPTSSNSKSQISKKFESKFSARPASSSIHSSVINNNKKSAKAALHSSNHKSFGLHSHKSNQFKNTHNEESRFHQQGYGKDSRFHQQGYGKDSRFHQQRYGKDSRLHQQRYGTGRVDHSLSKSKGQNPIVFPMGDTSFSHNSPYFHHSSYSEYPSFGPTGQTSKSSALPKYSTH